MKSVPNDLCHIGYALKLIDVVHFVVRNGNKLDIAKANHFGGYIDIFNKNTGRQVMVDVTLQTKDDKFARKLDRMFGTSLRVRRAFSDGTHGHLGAAPNVIGLYSTNIHYNF